MKSLGDMIARTCIEQLGGDSFGDRSSNSRNGSGGRSGSNGRSWTVEFERGEWRSKKGTSTKYQVKVRMR